jgi:hypothetical protein
MDFVLCYGRRIAGRLLWLAGPLFIKGDWNPSDMIATIMAEDAFDIGEPPRDLRADPRHWWGPRPLLPDRAVQGDRERYPERRLILYKNRAHGGTFADQRFGSDVVAFLTTERTHP